MGDKQINPRLMWVAERVRGGVFADVGTDHAKLPVYLVKNSLVGFAIASDIGEGPIARARLNITANGLSDSIKTEVCDGLNGLEKYRPTDIAVCGMGGETICNIIRAADFVKDGEIRLFLQPMTDFAMLRHFLADNGFEIYDEEIVLSERRMYQCVAAKYCGNTYILTEAEAELGKLNTERRLPVFMNYVRRRYNIVKKCVDGKMLSGADSSSEELLLAEYRRILEEP